MFTKIVALTAAVAAAVTGAVMNDRSADRIVAVPAAATATATFNDNDRGTGDPSTPGLTALFKGITVKARSVSAVVTAPPGLPVTNTTEISVLFGNRRVSKNYDRANGTTITFNYPVGDGKRHNEVLTINLTEQAPGGAIPYHWNRLAVIEPQFEVTISDLAFTLLNDCDPIGDSEIILNLADDRGVFDLELDMSAGETRRIHKFSRHLPAATVSDGLVVPQLSFFEDDLGGYHSQSSKPTTPVLLPGTTRHLKYDGADPGDEFCNAQYDYIIAINLLTFTSL